MIALNETDKVTVMRHNKDVNVHVAYVHGRFTFTWTYLPRHAMSDEQLRAGHQVCSLSDEGIDWIRGHHAPDSKEVAALRVAHALGKAK